MSLTAKDKIKLDPNILQKLGRKGNVLIVIQSALILADNNDFEDTHLKDLVKPKEFIESKAWKGKENGNGGAYWQLKEDGEIFNDLYDLAKAAMPSLNKLKYDTYVKDLINAFYAIPHLRGRKGRILEKDSLKGINLK